MSVDNTNVIEGLVQAVKDHAYAHYTDGWDVIVETMEDSEIAGRITAAAATTVPDAVAAFTDVVSLWLERLGPRWPDTYCQVHPGVRLLSVFPEEPPTDCMACIAEAPEPPPPLWWDDASYARWQGDPYAADFDQEQDQPQLVLLTDHTQDLCDGDTGRGRTHRCPACTADDAEAATIPF